MKILFVQNRFFPAIGGAETHVYLMSKYLTKRGHKVTVYTTYSLSEGDVMSFSFRPPFLRIGGKEKGLPAEEYIEGIKVKRFNFKFRYWSFNWIPDMFREMKATIREFDIVHAHGYHVSSSLVACYYAKKEGRTFVLTAHDLLIPPTLPVDAKYLKRIYDRTAGRYLLKNSLRLIALTEDNVQQYTERGASAHKIRLIPNGIELHKYKKTLEDCKTSTKFGINKENKVLLYVGRIQAYKGVQDVIEIMPQILARFPAVKFIVVGKDYGFKRELENLAGKLGVNMCTTFAGSVSEEEKIELYRRADIFVLPSKMEGFGIVLLEAMASGTLCIAYSIPSVRRVIKNGENGVLVKDKRELLSKLLYYLDFPEEKRVFEANALDYVQRFDVGNIIESIERVYLEVMR